MILGHDFSCKGLKHNVALIWSFLETDGRAKCKPKIKMGLIPRFLIRLF